ncbi:MAG: orotidine-5'-phosphate decarboxylase [Gammaproteobacteria bacterium]|nr:orotidine-5'-phosphate decarboxylase [Gammaproteobacteria bacterium]
MANKPIIIALDFPTATLAERFMTQVDPGQCRVKIGKELFTAVGPEIVRRAVSLGFDVFLDLKFHDIPNTVAGAVRVAAELGVWMMNVHASGGVAMMSEARSALDGGAGPRPLLIAVTVLTSLAASDLQQLGIPSEPAEQVSRLAGLTAQCGLDGVVCSAAETPMLRQQFPGEFALVTPGIRRPEDASGDQKRVFGPSDAMAMGSSYLVVGRPITQAESPAEALAHFNSAAAGVS